MKIITKNIAWKNLILCSIMQEEDKSTRVWIMETSLIFLGRKSFKIQKKPKSCSLLLATISLVFILTAITLITLSKMVWQKTTHLSPSDSRQNAGYTLS